MFKKHMTNSIIVIFFIALMSNMTFAQASIVDRNNLDKGIVSINYTQTKDKMKVLISKGNNKENYDLKSKMNYPLQFGNGQYTIQVLEHVSGNSYRQVGKETVNLNLQDQKELFLQSTQMTNWNNEMLAIKKAKELTKNIQTEEGKVKAIHNYVVNNIKYDTKKASSLQAGYLPSIDATIGSQSGICYDYAVLTGAMLRSVGLSTKLIMGYNVDITPYHAWNEVLIGGQWKIIDTTYDSAYANKNMEVNMFKNRNHYETTKIY